LTWDGTAAAGSGVTRIMKPRSPQTRQRPERRGWAGRGGDRRSCPPVRPAGQCGRPGQSRRFSPANSELPAPVDSAAAARWLATSGLLVPLASAAPRVRARACQGARGDLARPNGRSSATSVAPSASARPMIWASARRGGIGSPPLSATSPWGAGPDGELPAAAGPGVAGPTVGACCAGILGRTGAMFAGTVLAGAGYELAGGGGLDRPGGSWAGGGPAGGTLGPRGEPASPPCAPPGRAAGTPA
jgi:hypothetical protein